MPPNEPAEEIQGARERRSKRRHRARVVTRRRWRSDLRRGPTPRAAIPGFRFDCRFARARHEAQEARHPDFRRQRIMHLYALCARTCATHACPYERRIALDWSPAITL